MLIPKEELQPILKKYIPEELLPWALKFPPEFYEQMFRLKGWQFGSSYKKKQPTLAGKVVLNCIFDKLPKELSKKKLILDNQVAVVTTLMRISPNWRTFERHFNRAFSSFDQKPPKIEG